MTPIELTCEACGVLKTLTLREAEECVAAFREGDGESSAILIRRRHVRLPVDLPADYQRPGGERVGGRVRNLSDGGLLLLAHEALPLSTPLYLQLHAYHGKRSFEGIVAWNAGGPAAGKSSIAHGIRFTSPVTEGFAVELFLSESFPRHA